nr:MAG TPA: hypothetical protein [Caudoviricetes sp.]
MTNEERENLINSILPDTVKGQQRPAENLNPDMPYSTDFPQLINKDPASADVFNLINRQLLSNDKKLGDSKADKTYVDKKVADLINGAPEQLDTLQELSKALNNDKDYAATVNNALAEKLGRTEKAVSAETADSANTLEGVPLSHGGDSTFGKIPVVGDDGLLEIGKYIDFHSKNGDKKDYSARIEANDDGTLSFTGSIRANITGNAFTANKVPWSGVTNKPSTYPPSAHTHGLINSDFTALVGGGEDDTWGAIGINADGHVLKSIRVNKAAPDWLLANYSAGIAFGGEDTRGVISASYDVPKVKFAGGNGNKPNWHYSLLGTSGKEYNLDSYAGAGIVSHQLAKVGYVKYSNGLIYLWGFATLSVQKYVDWSFPVSIEELFQLFMTDVIQTSGTTTEYPESQASMGWVYISATKNSVRLVATRDVGLVSVFAIGRWK